MLNRLTLFVVFGTLMLGLASCGEAPPAKQEEPVKAETKAPEPAGPYYELTKEDMSGHEGWSSKNIMVLGTKLGDKTNEVAVKNLGEQMGKTTVLADEYQTFYQKNGIGIYTFKLTNKITKIELLQGFADRLGDAKLKSLLSSGDLKQMRAIFGMEEATQDKPEEMGTEYVYDARGIRFIKYKNGIHGLRFSEKK